MRIQVLQMRKEFSSFDDVLKKENFQQTESGLTWPNQSAAKVVTQTIRGGLSWHI
jgi:hypothetical protein